MQIYKDKDKDLSPHVDFQIWMTHNVKYIANACFTEPSDIYSWQRVAKHVN